MHHLKLDLYFILGRGHHPDTKLDSEMKENRDILIGDFFDSYTNLTRKTQVWYDYSHVCDIVMLVTQSWWQF